MKKLTEPEFTKLREASEQAKARLDQQEVKAVMDELLEQVTQAQMDDKFEEALD